jgi:GntR family transcriptional repressor for pyruvate dehydrogenase complex
MASMPSRAEEITGILRSEILRGQYRPGERLPSERELSTRFESNRGAIRESIKKLEQLGIVVVSPGGVRVQPIEDATLEVLGYLLDLGEIQKPELIGQILDVMGAMVSLSARSAVSEASEEQLQALHEIATALIGSLDKEEKHHQTWQALTDTFIAINHNLVLRLVGNGLRTQFMGYITNLQIKPDIDIVLVRQELTNLEEAIKYRNPGLAADAIIRHFQLIKSAILETMEGTPTGEARTRRIGNA